MTVRTGCDRDGGIRDGRKKISGEENMAIEDDGEHTSAASTRERRWQGWVKVRHSSQRVVNVYAGDSREDTG